MEAYLTLDPFPDVRAVLPRLADRPCAILSNGTPRMLADAVAHTGIGRHLRAVISVDEVRTFKPAPVVYALGAARLGLPPGTIGFVSSNGWDVAGARAFGFPAIWVNRSGVPPEELGVAPDLEVRDLAGLAHALGCD
jgi:2-haloacid dehalogenase